MRKPTQRTPSPAGHPSGLRVPRWAHVDAVLLFAVWMLATWFLEGRIETFLRPRNPVDRAIYALVANVLIGTVLAILLLSHLVRHGQVSVDRAGFGRRAASPLSLAAALVLGLGAYALQGAPTWDPIILLNAYAQVFVVTVAEVVVCWTLVGSTFEVVLRPHGRAVSLIGAALIASVAFGVYHYAHSPPFNTLPMVLLLVGVGIVTGVFFFASRDVYATAIFHNFLGVFGVVTALEASGRIGAMQQVQAPLLVMAVVAVAALVLAHRFFLARSVSWRATHPGSVDLRPPS